MATPTVTSAGATGGFLLITDHDGHVRRIVKGSLCCVKDSSNGVFKRLDVEHNAGEITLLFPDAASVTTFLAALDALY